MNIKSFFLSILACIVLTSCGYTFQGSGSVLPPDVKKIQIPIVENNSPDSLLTQLVTEALRDQFERYGVVTVVEDVTEADAVLKAKILKVSRKARTVTSNTDTVQQYDTSMDMSAELRKANGQVLWANPSFSISKAVGTSKDLVVSSSADFASGNLSSSDLASQDSREVARGQEQDALDNISRLAARKIYDDAVAPDF
jgi:outer membrane lipopolysaccharide assembly protein LptE/RlpB